MSKKLKERYKSPTPWKFRLWGDSILIGSTFLAGSVMTLPIQTETKLWINFVIGIIGTAGKIITNCYTMTPPDPNEPPIE